MNQTQNSKQFDLENRTFIFAKQTRFFLKQIPKNIINIDDVKQLIRSSGSIGANYIEANESLSKKDFMMRIKISRKETKESIYWLNLISIDYNPVLEKEKLKLIDEATQLMKIFGAILEKCK